MTHPSPYRYIKTYAGMSFVISICNWRLQLTFPAGADAMSAGRTSTRGGMPATLDESRTGDVGSGQVRPPPLRSSWLLTLLKAGLSVLAIGVLAYTADLSAAWKLL